MPRLPLLLTLLALPLVARAESVLPVWTSDAGTPFVEDRGDPGTLLRSTGPVTYRVGAAGAPVTGVEAVLLRPDCTARSALVGEGAWMAQPDGLAVLLVEGAGLRFPGQEPPFALRGLCGRP